MGKTSVYLTSDLDARWRKAGVPLAQLISEALDAREVPPADLEATLRRVIREEVPPPAECRGSGYGASGYESEPYLSDP